MTMRGRRRNSEGERISAMRTKRKTRVTGRMITKVERRSTSKKKTLNSSIKKNKSLTSTRRGPRKWRRKKGQGQSMRKKTKSQVVNRMSQRVKRKREKKGRKVRESPWMRKSQRNSRNPTKKRNRVYPRRSDSTTPPTDGRT